MDLQERIVLSKDEMLHSIEILMEKMRVFRYDTSYRQYFGDKFVDKFITWEADIEKHKCNPFTVVVVGNFKRGKSTLINAFLKEMVETTDVTPETVTLNRISYGKHSNEAVMSKGRRVKLSDDELKRNSLEGLFDKLEEPITQLEIKRPNDLLRNFTIIDTPGLDDALKDYSDLVKSCLMQADCVIYVFSSLYPLSQTEQFFLRSAILPQKFTSLFIVGNYTDNYESEFDANRVNSVIKDRIYGLLPQAKIYMVSALDEICRVLNVSRPNPAISDFLETEFNNLRHDVFNLVDEKAESVVADRMQRLSLAMCIDLSNELNSIEQGLHMDREAGKKALEKIYFEEEENAKLRNQVLRDLKNQIDSMKSETKLWMSEFLQRIIDETQNLSKESDENLRKYYEYYCIDLLQNALNTCIEYHREQLFDILENVNSAFAHKFSEILPTNNKYHFRFKLDNRIWTKGDNVGLAISLLQGHSHSLLATIGLMAVDGITGYLRERETSMRTSEIIGQIKGKMTELSLSIDKTVEELYQSISVDVMKLVDEYFKTEMDEKEHLVKQAIKVSEQEDDTKKIISKLINNAKNILAKTEKEITLESF